MENEEGGAEDEKVIKMLEPFFHVRRAECFFASLLLHSSSFDLDSCIGYFKIAAHGSASEFLLSTDHLGQQLTKCS